MYCPECGTEQSDGANFCTECGADFREHGTQADGRSDSSRTSEEPDGGSTERGGSGPSSTPDSSGQGHVQSAGAEDVRVPRSSETATGLAVQAGTYTASNGGVVSVSYRIEDSRGQTMLTADPDWDGLGDALGTIDLPVTAPNGDTLCRIQGQQVINVTGGAYAVVDPETDTQRAVFEQDGSLTQPAWVVRDGETGDLLFRARNQSKLSGFTRNKTVLRSAIPAEYAIVDGAGQQVGAVRTGKLSSTYDVDVTDDTPARDVALLLPLFIHVLEVDR